MTLDQIETFVQVARTRSFSRAAILLDLAQPTLSGRIAALESELGTSVFMRHGHRLDLTEAGRVLLPYAERMLALRAEGINELLRVRDGGLGRLTLGPIHHAVSISCRALSSTSGRVMLLCQFGFARP